MGFFLSVLLTMSDKQKERFFWCSSATIGLFATLISCFKMNVIYVQTVYFFISTVENLQLSLVISGE